MRKKIKDLTTEESNRICGACEDSSNHPFNYPCYKMQTGSEEKVEVPE